MSSLILKPGREKSLLRRHPWIFSGAIERVDGNPESGATLDLLSARGNSLARAAYSPSSQIRARVWTFDPSEAVDADFFRRRISRAVGARLALAPALAPGVGASPAPTDAYRIIHAESDGIPGLIVDRYADVLVAQFLTAGAEFWRETLADILLEITGLQNISERSDADVRDLEGLPPRVGS
ncbi:MAG: 23S rRNA (cytosine(1962)-C(5))-methyltransferase RlmI, partial [Anaerolineales bacterium]|nr:23S rRNA (cytosine(1962)-C(5))-methyltransferase RlmI [Anaerolineales bacterium]